MALDLPPLHEPSQRVLRIVGRDLLARVRDNAVRLGDADDADALHDFRVAVRRLRSWIRAFDADLAQTMRPKAARRLKRVADATRESRDLEVHIAWAEAFAKANRGRYADAAQALIERLRARKTVADAKLHSVVASKLDRATAQIAQGFSRYVVNLDVPDSPFALRLAKLVSDHANAARVAASRVSTIGDRAEAHAARISAKRLRYLIEPVAGVVAGAEDLVERLSTYQDDFGALHDAQIFGSEIAGMLAKALAAKSTKTHSAVEDDASHDAARQDEAAALRAASRRLHRQEVTSFDRIQRRWLGAGAESLWVEAERIAAELTAP